MVVVFAHRGASGYAPDNTIQSFDLAIEMGTHAIETDVKITRDRQLVFFHDFGIGKMPWFRPVLWLSLKGLQRRAAVQGFKVPTVFEGFQYYKRKGTLQDISWSVDVPAHWCAEALVRIGNHFKNLDKILFCNEQLKPRPRWIKQGVPPSQFVWSIRDRQIAKLGVDGVIAACQENDVRIINIKEGWLSCRLARAIKSAGIKLFVWDAHDERRLVRTLSLAPHALYTNYPDVALKIVRENGLKPARNLTPGLSELI